MVVSLHKEGLTPAQIVRKTKFERHFVQRWIRRYEATGTVADAPRLGRPSVMTRKLKARVLRLAIDKQRRSLRRVAAMLKQRQNSSGPSYETVRRTLQQAGAHPYHRTVIPRVTARQAQRRRAFATKYRDVPWSHYIFTDEKRFRLYAMPNRKNDIVWAYDKSQVPGYEVQQGGPSLFVWAGMSVHGVTPLRVIPGTMKAPTYQTILQSTLLPAAQEWFPDGHWVLQRDGATPHVAKSTTAWLQQNGIQYIPADDWPPNSPDLNPMENVWAWTQSQLQGRKISTSEGLCRALAQIWKHVPKSMLLSLVHSMPDRLAAVRQSRGAAIKKY
jgi:transposase